MGKRTVLAVDCVKIGDFFLALSGSRRVRLWDAMDVALDEAVDRARKICRRVVRLGCA